MTKHEYELHKLFAFCLLLKYKKNLLSLGGLKTTYMAGFEDAQKQILDEINRIMEAEHDKT